MWLCPIASVTRWRVSQIVHRSRRRARAWCRKGDAVSRVYVVDAAVRCRQQDRTSTPTQPKHANPRGSAPKRLEVCESCFGDEKCEFYLERAPKSRTLGFILLINVYEISHRIRAGVKNSSKLRRHRKLHVRLMTGPNRTIFTAVDMPPMKTFTYFQR